MPSQPLIPLNIDLPANQGINSEAYAGGLTAAWAQTADNCVFDAFGRLCAREAFKKTTTTPITGNPSMDTLFEYVVNTATTNIISVSAEPKIYSGTGTLTDRTGSLSFTETHWKFQNYESEVVGFAQGEDPIYWDGSAASFDTLHSKHAAYATSTAYVLGDTVKAVASPTTDRYFVCTIAGTSAGSEPTWATTEGATTTDNTVTWTTVPMPKGRECLSAYGRVFALREDRTTIDYSALAFPHKFDTTNGGGTIDTKLIFARNDDWVTSIATFNNNLVIFSRFNTLIYTGINDPDNLAIVDQIVGTGCVARDSVKNIGSDLVFLSFQGLRSLGRTVELEKVPLQELSLYIRDELINEVRGNLPSPTNDTAIKAEYSPELGIYVLKVGDLVYCFDFKQSYDVREGFTPPRATTWSEINIQSIALARDGTLYLAKSGVIGTYSGYNEWGLLGGAYVDNKEYKLEYRSAWVDMGEIDPSLRSRVKFVKKYNAYFLGGTGYSVDFTLGYDFKDYLHRRTKVLSVSSGDEWSQGEWGIAEWSGDTEKRFSMVQHGGSGDTIQLGLDVNIQGAGFCVSRIILYIKLGRLARGSTT